MPDIYRELQQRLDTYSIGFPATASGIEIKILQKLFTPEEAGLFLAMSPMVETPESVAARTGMPAEETATRLEDMAARGLLFRLKKGGGVRYGAIPFVHGLIEFKIKDIEPGLVRLFQRYYNEGFSQNFSKVNGTFLRTIPIGQAITPEHHIAALDDVEKILQGTDTIVVTECMCRKGNALLGHGCGGPIEACFMFGSMARYYIDNDLGRQVTAAEALDLIRKAQAAGLVTQPATSQNPNGLCNCCADCCGVLAALKKTPRPADMVYSNHYSEVLADDCIGCEECVASCHMAAIGIAPDGKAAIARQRCIGCGVCVPRCPVGAIALREKPEAERRVLPKNAFEQMMLMAQERKRHL
jgi:Pyruvate/2-oxoacid:ferredoxin oxidoreductase delta subunit